MAAILFISNDRWRVGRVGGSIVDIPAHASSTAELAKAVCSAIRSIGHRGDTVRLALDSMMCLSGTIPLADLPRNDRRKAMIYRLEDQLPLAAEDVAADFIEHPERSTAMGIAVPLDKLRPIVESLEAHGLAVEAIHPATLLACAALPSPSLEAHDLLVWHCGQSLDVMTLSAGRITDWHVCASADEEAIGLAVDHAASSLGRPLRVMAMHLDDPNGRMISTRAASVAAVSQAPGKLADRDEAALAAAARAETLDSVPALQGEGLTGARGPTRLQRPLRAALAGVLLLLLATIAGSLWRAHRYEQIASQNRERMEAIYRDLAPGTRIPASITSRLASEWRRLSGTSSAHGMLPAPDATDQLLHDVLARLPRDVRFRVNELRVDQSSALIEGEVRTHGDARRIADALRAAPTDRGRALDVAEPSTEQRSDRTVRFTITATPASAATGVPRQDKDGMRSARGDG